MGSALTAGFRKAVGRPGTHQGELAWRQLEHRDDLHHHAPQRQAGATDNYLLTSLRTKPEALLREIRGRWSIEYEQHRPQDTQLHEDAHR